MSRVLNTNTFTCHACFNSFWSADPPTPPPDCPCGGARFAHIPSLAIERLTHELLSTCLTFLQSSHNPPSDSSYTPRPIDLADDISVFCKALTDLKRATV